MAGEKGKRRTVHGQERHRGGNRPTSQAFQDKEDPVEVYQQRDGRMIYVGRNSRTHVFEGDAHLTSFRMAKRARERKVKLGYWKRLF